MLVHAKKIVALGVMALVVAVISLPVALLAATSPAVSVLNPLTQGLRAPVKITLDADGNAYVADQRVGGVVKFNAYGVQQMTIRTTAAPAGIALALDGSLLVSQSGYVARYDVVSGQEIGRLADGYLRLPVGIAVDDITGYIYVVDGGSNQVVVFTATGGYVKSFAAGLLSSPSGIAFEKISRQFAVANTYGNKVQFFDVDGNLKKSVGNPVSTALGASILKMQFAAPVAIAFEYSKDQSPVLNRMYVVDAFQGNIQVVDPAGSGAFLSYIGSIGTINGQLMVPSDAIFDAVNNRLLVVNGLGNITIYGIDGGKNPVYVDSVPPAFTVNPIPAEVATKTFVISGTVEAGSTVQVSSGGIAVVGAVVYAGSTTWSAEISGFVAGNNSFTVTAKDAAGNIAPALAVAVNYLVPAPVVVISPVPSVTKSTKITINGTVDADAKVVVTQAGAEYNAVVTGTTWSCEVTLAVGINNLTVTAQKPQSAQSVASVMVTLDSSAPLLTVSALANGSYTSTPVQNISGTVTDQNSVSVSVNGTPATLSGTAFSVPVTLLNGSNLITVVAVDVAGNTTTDSRALYFDATKPVIAIMAPVDNSITSSAVLKLSGSVDKASFVTVAGVAVVSDDANNWSATVDLIAGVNTIEIVATDLSGNSSSVKRSVTLDTSRPTLSIETPAQDVAVNIPNVLIKGSVSDNAALTLEYSVSGSPVVTLPVSGSTYSFNVDFAAEGNYPIVITVKDSAGNATSAVRNVIYDITPPVFTLDQSKGIMPEKLSGSVEAGSSVVIKDGSLPIGSINISNSSWSADLSGVNYNPDKLLAVATDAAGNSTSKTLSYSFPDGTLSAGGKPTIQDALRAIRLVVNQVNPTALELAHYDIGPLVGGKPNPNGKIEIVDAILILRKALGLKSW